MARKRNSSVRKIVNRWTEAEEQVLIRYVKARPQNLHYCFMMVADHLGRTEGAVANHWYSKVSKRNDAFCFFTASSKHVSKNRKNGEGVASNESIWKKFIKILNRI